MAKDSSARQGRHGKATTDDWVFDAARDVLGARPAAPMAEIAGHAGVGIATVYRRFQSRDALVEALYLDGLRRLEGDVPIALDRARSFPWGAFVGFMTGALASGAAPLVAALAGTFPRSDEVLRAEQRLQAAIAELVEATQDAGAVRRDLAPGDVALLFEQLQAVQVDDKRREATLRRRYLELSLQALRAPGAAPLPGPAPTAVELLTRYDAR